MRLGGAVHADVRPDARHPRAFSRWVAMSENGPHRLSAPASLGFSPMADSLNIMAIRPIGPHSNWGGSEAVCQETHYLFLPQRERHDKTREPVFNPPLRMRCEAAPAYHLWRRAKKQAFVRALSPTAWEKSITTPMPNGPSAWRKKALLVSRLLTPIPT